MADDRVRLTGLREFCRLFLSIASPYVRRRLALSIVVAGLVACLASVAPLALTLIVDNLDRPDRAHAGVLTIPLLLVALYVGMQWLNRMLGSIQLYVHAQAERRTYRILSDRLFDHVIRLPLKFHLQRRTGAVNETLTNGLTGYQMVQQVLLTSIVPVVVQLGTVSAVLVTLNQTILLLLLLGAVGSFGTAFAHGAMQSRRAARRASAAQIETRALMTDSILNYETVKYFTAEAVLRERLDQSSLKSEQDWMQFHRARARNTAFVATIFALFLGATMAYAVREVDAGRMTVGTFILVNAYVLQLVAPIEMIGAAAQTLAQGTAFLEKLMELFRESPEPPLRQAITPLEGPGALVFENVTAGYQSDHAVLRTVSFALPAGKTLGIVGASGAGKSTLVRLLVRLMEPDSGRILIDGRPLTETDSASVRATIAVVPQDTVLLNDTIANNIALGRPGCTPDQIEESARLAQLHDFIMRLPEGYQTRVGERGVRLSGGEKQRVSIARAVLKRPKILVFDEATSSLDSRAEQAIMENLRRLAGSRTTLIIAHRLATVVQADEVVVLDRGSIVERGTHEGLLKEQGAYARLWQAQQVTTYHHASATEFGD